MTCPDPVRSANDETRSQRLSAARRRTLVGLGTAILYPLGAQGALTVPDDRPLAQAGGAGALILHDGWILHAMDC